MNKKILSSLVFILTSLCLSAQDFHLGIKAGANLNHFNLPDNDRKGAIGYTFGGFLYYDFTKSIGFQVEALYGRSTDYTSALGEERGSGGFPQKARINYLSFPVLLKVDVTDFFSVVAGPQFNQLRNGGRYRYSDGTFVYPSGVQASFTAGVDLGPFYFRYLHGRSGFNGLGAAGSYGNTQYQFGFRVVLL